MTETPTNEPIQPDPSAPSATAYSPEESDSTSDQAPQDPGTQQASNAQQQEDPLTRTRAGQTWVALIIFAIVLILLLIFILENTQKVGVTYFAQTAKIPLAVAMLLAAVAGVLLAAIAGTLRIIQLRRRVKRGQQT
jgi:uncharacterized integral membrane protein